ncbi:MAG: class I SAM-dependent methyltransferase, partial [Desulfohalobiaceae bacterium]
MSSRSPSSVKTECNQAKADFFDSQAQSAWAAAEYSEQERSRIFQVLEKLPDLRGNTVLEPGCGTGRLSRILSSQVGSQGLVIAMDISPKMIQAARENLQETNNVYLCCSALESMKLPLGEVDVVFCHQVFPHFDCKKTALAKMSRS